MFGAIPPIVREDSSLAPFGGGRLTSDSRLLLDTMCRSMMCFLSPLSASLQAIIHIILLLIHQGLVYRSVVDRRCIGTISKLVQNRSCGGTAAVGSVG